MTINWFASLKDVPWTKVLDLAPSIVESGRKLWSRGSNKEAEISTAQNPLEQTAPPGAEALAALEIRVLGLEKRTTQLGEEVVASFDVVRSLTQQHSHLVSAVDVLLVRTGVLIRVCVLLGLVSAALFVLILSR